MRLFTLPNGSRLSCGRAHTTLAPTGGRLREDHQTGRPTADRPAHPDRVRQLQPLVRRHPVLARAEGLAVLGSRLRAS